MIRPAVTCPTAASTPLESAGRVGKINEYAEWLTAFDAFQPTRHVVDRLQTTRDRGQIDAVGQADRGRRQAIVDVVRADHFGANRHGFASGGKQKCLLAGVMFDRRGRNFGCGVNRDG